MKKYKRWPTDAKAHKHMKDRQAARRLAGPTKAEAWALTELLLRTKLNWNREVIWGFRLLDLWCSSHGINVEVDGKEHNKINDEERDHELSKSGIIVIRIRNFNFDDLNKAISQINTVERWAIRKKRMRTLRKQRLIKLALDEKDKKSHFVSLEKVQPW